MIIHVANPIYDSVFKYLMEDERIARTILSALLKLEVIKVEVRPHEYANESANNISMFRIDFGATIRKEDGKEELILIELQKIWLETETLRFRQYLATQYANKNNVVKDEKGSHAYPTVAIYILGHRVGDIDVPVLYVRHKSYDYNGNEVTKGMPNAFVESLIHDSIIVQIPLLHGQINNRLEKVLSVFDQTYKDKKDNHLLRLDEDAYSDDSSMEYILRRLMQAATSPDVRQDMNVEDEYFSAIADRDLAIETRQKRIEEQETKLKEQDSILKEQSSQLKEQSSQLKEQSSQLKEQSSQLKEQSSQLKEQSSQLKEQSSQIAQQTSQLKEQSSQIAQQTSQLKEQSSQIAQQTSQLQEQSSQLKEQKAIMRAMVENMRNHGMTLEQIAQMTGKSIDEINRLISK